MAVGKIVQTAFNLPDIAGVIENSQEAKAAFDEMRGISSDEIELEIEKHLRAYLLSPRRGLVEPGDYESATLDVARLMSIETVAAAAALEAIERPDGLAAFLRSRPESAHIRATLREDVEPFFDDTLGAVARILVTIAPTNPKTQFEGLRATLRRLDQITGTTAQVLSSSAQVQDQLRDLHIDVKEGFENLLAAFAQGPDGLRKHLATAEQLRIKRTEHFVGRSFVFEQVDDLLHQDQTGYLLLRGQPGIGKSALMAELVRRRGSVFHFNVASAGIRSARAMLLNLCAQLIIRYKLPYSGLPATAGLDASFLSRLLAEAAERAAVTGELPIVLVIDALDESEEPAEFENRLKLPPELPDGVVVIATIRDKVDDALDVAVRLPQLALLADDPRNLDDIRLYLHQMLASSAVLADRSLTLGG